VSPTSVILLEQLTNVLTASRRMAWSLQSVEVQLGCTWGLEKELALGVQRYPLLVLRKIAHNMRTETLSHSIDHAISDEAFM
jgi:hypothetical protein